MRKILLSMMFALFLFIGLAQAYVPFEDNILRNPSFEIAGNGDTTLNCSSYATDWSYSGYRSCNMGEGYQKIRIPANAFLEVCYTIRRQCSSGSPRQADVYVSINGSTISSAGYACYNCGPDTIEYNCYQTNYFRGYGYGSEEFTFRIWSATQNCWIKLDAVSIVAVEHIKRESVDATPYDVYEDTTTSVETGVMNWQDGSPYTYTVGFTYGHRMYSWYDSANWTIGYYQVWADPDYNSGYFRDGLGNWVTITLNQGDWGSKMRTMYVPHYYMPDTTTDDYPDLFVSVRDSSLNILSYWVMPNAFRVYGSGWDIERTSYSYCYGGDCTPPIYPAYGANFTLSSCFRNTGSTHTFGIKTRIGNETIGWCNEDCIRDGMGVIVNKSITSGDVECLTRTFTPPVWSDPSKFYDVVWEIYDTNMDLVEEWEDFHDENIWQPSGVAPPPPFAYAHAVSVNATWVRYGYPYSPDHLAVTAFILNNGTYGQNFTLGMSIGEWCVPAGIYTSVQEWYACGGEEPCNEACYVDGLYKWIYRYIPAGESASFTRVFKIPSYFDVGEWFDVVVGVWNISEPYDTTGLVSWTLFDNKTRVVTIAPPPPPPVGVDAEIVSWGFSDRQPLIDDEITVKIWIRNTGNVSFNFPVGLSIGNESNMIYCNKDCYTDGKGDYVYTGTMYVGETRMVQRTFKFYDDWFDVHKYYDVRMGVYHAEDIPYYEALDWQTLDDYIYTSAIEDKLDAYAISARAIPYQNTRKGLVSIESYIKNSGSITWNYTLGMSIGLFDAVDGHVYRVHRPELIPPCNTYCYVDCEEYDDNLCVYPQWRFSWIPPNYTMPFERKFRIPDYFLPNASFDVAIGVWSKPPEDGGKLVSIVYFKNVSFVSSELAPEVKYGETAKQYLDKGYIFMKAFLGWDIPTINMMAWLLFTTILTVVTAYYTRESQMGSATPTFLVFILLLIAGAVVKLGGQPFLPPWIPVVLIIISGLIWAKFMGIIGK